MTSKFDKAHWLAFLLPAALLAGAYGSQYIGGLFPCEMCWWQRYPHFAAVAIAAIAFGVGGLLGAAASDVARALMESQSLAYASVFSIESGLFIASAYLASKVEK